MSRIQTDHVIQRPHAGGVIAQTVAPPEPQASRPGHVDEVVITAAGSGTGGRQRRKGLLSYFGLGVGLLVVLTGIMLMTAVPREAPPLIVLAERSLDETHTDVPSSTLVVETRVIKIEGRRVLALPEELMVGSNRSTLVMIQTADRHAWRAEIPELVDGPVRIEIREPVGTLCLVTLIEGASP